MANERDRAAHGGTREPDLTLLLAAWRRGEPGSEAKLIAAIYAELRRLAAAQLRRERSDHTLQPTALVHEAYLRLTRQRRVDWQSRRHFFAIAAQQMRRILVDHARRRGAKRRSDMKLIPLEAAPPVAGLQADWDFIALDEALERLAGFDPAKARLVELRFFGGLAVEEVCAVLEISPATYHRHWSFVRAWLFRALAGDGKGAEP